MTESNPPPPPSQPPLDYSSPIPPAMETIPDAKTWGMLCHLSALAGYFIPFGNVIGPLVVWLVKREQYPFVDNQGKESLNFQITMMIAAIISAFLICVVIGIFLLIAVGITDLILIIVASIQASSGKPYRYPFCLRLVK